MRWDEPQVWEEGETYGELRALLRRARKVVIVMHCVRDRFALVDYLNFSPRVLHKGLIWRPDDAPMYCRLDLRGSLWVGS